jgi:hypothetical protein
VTLVIAASWLVALQIHGPDPEGYGLRAEVSWRGAVEARGPRTMRQTSVAMLGLKPQQTWRPGSLSSAPAA